MEVSDADRRKEWSTSQSGMTQTVGTDADIIGVPRSVLAAACYIIHNSEHAESETAKAMRKYALSTQAAERGEPVTEKRIVALGNIALAYENDQRENAFDIALDAAYSAGRKSAPPTEAQIRADDVILDLLIDGVEPTHENLVVAIAAYPQHRDALVAFFANLAVQTALKDEPVASNHAAYTIAAAIRSLKESDNGAG